MSGVTITPGEPVFSFRSKQDWVNKGPQIWRRHGATSANTICVDQKGRLVQRGEHFQRAQDDGSYPVTVYWTQPGSVVIGGGGQ